MSEVAPKPGQGQGSGPVPGPKPGPASVPNPAPSPAAMPGAREVTPEDVREQLAAAGAGLPDELSDKMAVVDGTMETYFISANDLVAQDGMSIKP